MQNSEARVLTLAVGALATQQSTTDERLDHFAEAVGAREERVIALGSKVTADIVLVGATVQSLKDDLAELKQVADTRHTAVTTMLQTLLDRTNPTP